MLQLEPYQRKQREIKRYFQIAILYYNAATVATSFSAFEMVVFIIRQKERELKTNEPATPPLPPARNGFIICAAVNAPPSVSH